MHIERLISCRSVSRTDSRQADRASSIVYHTWFFLLSIFYIVQIHYFWSFFEVSSTEDFWDFCPATVSALSILAFNAADSPRRTMQQISKFLFWRTMRQLAHTLSQWVLSAIGCVGTRQNFVNLTSDSGCGWAGRGRGGCSLQTADKQIRQAQIFFQALCVYISLCLSRKTFRRWRESFSHTYYMCAYVTRYGCIST